MNRTHPTPLIASIILSAAGLAPADEIIVPTQMPLSVAIAVAADGDTITLLPSGSPYQQFPGFAISGKRLTLRGATGNPGDIVLDGAGIDITLRITNGDGSLLENLTIRNGRGGAGTDASGAGVWLSNSDVTIRNCVIRDNIIPGADGNGAGLYGSASSVRVEGCLIENNTCPSTSADGLGVYMNGGNHTFVDTVLRSNGVSANIVPTNSAIGGGFYADGGTAFFARCHFEGNRSGLGGGIGVSGSMTLTIDHCVFEDNASRYGAGLYITNAAGGGTSRVRNSVFVGNSTSVNDAAMYLDKPAILTNLTVVGNTAAGSYIVGGNAAVGTVWMDNCIFSGNTYNVSNGIFPSSTPDRVRSCILQQAYAGASGSTGNRVVDPTFVNAATRDLRLMPGSPAIDAGNGDLYFGPFADLDGNDRAVDDPDTADTGFSITGPVIDIGAYEFQIAPPPPACPADFNQDGGIDGSDIESFFAAWESGSC